MSKIVVGVDASLHARAALRWAIEEAVLRKVDVIALHTFNLVPGGLGVVPSYVDLRPAATSLLEEEVGKAVAEVGADVTIRSVVVVGDAGTALVRAGEPDDLIVVGSRGHGALVGALLSSTSHYVASHAQCPVVVVRAPRP